MKKIILILLFFCLSKSTLQAQEVGSDLTLITTDRMDNTSRQNFNWSTTNYTNVSARPDIDCPSDPNKCKKKSFWEILASLFNWIPDAIGDLVDLIGGIFHNGGGGNPTTGGSPIGPPAGPIHGVGNIGTGNQNSPPGGGSNPPPPIVITPPTNPSGVDDDEDDPTRHDCVGISTTTKKFIVSSDTCPTGKSINTYQITTDCYGNTFTSLINQECFQCDNYPVGYGYSNTDILNWVENSYLANSSTSFITMPSVDAIKKWNAVANFHLSARQVAQVDTLRKNGATEISVNDIAKIQQSGDSLTQFVNFDDYSVQVDSLPTIATKKQTATQLLEYIRLNFEKFQDTTFQKITPYNAANKTLWANTTKFKKATGVILKIQRSSGNNGVAIASNINDLDTTSKKFVITNVTDPNLNGKRNFNTNREFGYKKNDDNTYTFYCRTVDRTSKQSNFLNKVLNDTLIEADRSVGETFSKKVADFINQNDGVAVENDFEIIQADEQNIKDVLIGLNNLCGLANNNQTKCPAGSIKDNCGTCVGGSTGKKPCKVDCAGVWGGTAFKDSCSICVGGTTGKNPCNKIIPCPTDSTFYVTKAMFLKINPNGNQTLMDSVAKYINLYKHDPDFKINTRLRLAHFIAQVTAETDGFTIMAEGYNYSEKALLKKKKLFDTSNVKKYVNCICVFDRMYCCNKNENGDEASKDGSKYRGQGIIQLTWKEVYRKFTEYYQRKFNDYSVSFVTNPELLQTNMKYSVLAGLWEATHYRGGFNKYADEDDGKKYSRGVNTGDPNATYEANGEPKRLKNLAIAKKALCL